MYIIFKFLLIFKLFSKKKKKLKMTICFTYKVKCTKSMLIIYYCITLSAKYQSKLTSIFLFIFFFSFRQCHWCLFFKKSQHRKHLGVNDDVVFFCLLGLTFLWKERKILIQNQNEITNKKVNFSNFFSSFSSSIPFDSQRFFF